MASDPHPSTNALAQPVQRRCENCQRELLGEHCYACGQPTRGLVRHFGSILGDFFDSVFDLDSRIFRTLGPLFFRPGFLSREYFSGRRVRYVSPVRLFVFLCIVAFFALRLVVETDVRFDGGSQFDALDSVEAVETERDALLAELDRSIAQLGPGAPGVAGIETARQAVIGSAAKRIAELRGDAPADAATADEAPVPPELRFGDRPWDAEANPLRLDWLPEAGNRHLNDWIGRGRDNIARVRQDPALLVDAFIQSLPSTFFVLLPLFALLLKLFYAFKRRLYMEHLIVALHSHAFLCAALLLLAALDGGSRLLTEDSLGHRLIGLLELGVGLWMPVYLWLMQKRVYGQGVIMTSLKFAALGTLYMALLGIGTLVTLLASLVAL
ncbi:DUF3667 domain-containing protein [Pseudomarimonas salicorniae]|uniref:DUF3667 domain-containing protein n=1 Tax=Pseudomarimonas salicorniae TaxID=2933270 RepID=A0ABT0GEM5_9GAMM|nr:DUF3667 domain-containing protein [Lysobacter sp. CAU 1642]MCK7592482.1 DUF3667 domain-containing protein [Lysobacter sp. CAU 1642]